MLCMFVCACVLLCVFVCFVCVCAVYMLCICVLVCSNLWDLCNCEQTEQISRAGQIHTYIYIRDVSYDVFV
jgi:hypothetical protein